MAVVAVGGYGRGTLAPGSDIDLLFLLPVQADAVGREVVEYMLYMLWDIGLKVGHATRNVDECVRLSRADITIRTSILEARFLLGDRALFDELLTRFDKEVVQDTGAEYRRRPSSPSATTGTPRPARAAIWSSPTSRTARAACATCRRCSGSPSISTASARGERTRRRPAFSRAQEYNRFLQGRGFSLGRALPHALPDRQGGGAAAFRHPARDRRAGSATPATPACRPSSAS